MVINSCLTQLKPINTSSWWLFTIFFRIDEKVQQQFKLVEGKLSENVVFRTQYQLAIQDHLRFEFTDTAAAMTYVYRTSYGVTEYVRCFAG